MATTGAILGIVAGALALVAFLATVWARFRVSADETTATLWKGEADAQKARGDRLEAELAAQRIVIADLVRRVETVEQENRVLRSLNDYRDEIVSLREHIDNRFNNLPCHLSRDEESS